jgi:DNA-binding beta-propeller fold protein YncE
MYPTPSPMITTRHPLTLTGTVVAFITCLSPLANAQHMAARTETYGVSCRGSYGKAPSLTSTLPGLGSNLALRLADGPANAPTMLFVDGSRQSFSLGVLAPGCSLYLQPNFFFPNVTNSNGRWPTPHAFALPNVPSLRGVKATTQLLARDRAANLLGFVFSNGLELTIGNTLPINRTLPLGVRNTGIALSADDKTIFVVSWQDPAGRSVHEFDNATGKLIKSYSSPSYNNHADIVLSSDENYFYTTDYYPGTISRVNRATGSVAKGSAGAWPSGIGITPDGKKIVVLAGRDGRSSNLKNDRLSVFTPNLGLLGSVNLSAEIMVTTPAISADGKFAYVPIGAQWDTSVAPQVVEVSLTSYTVTRTVTFPKTTQKWVLPGVAIASNLGRLYVSDIVSRKIHVVSLATFKIVSSIDLPSVPSLLRVSPDERVLAVMLPGQGVLEFIDTATNTSQASVMGFKSGVQDMEFSRSGEFMYIADFATKSILRVGSWRPNGLFVDDFENGVIDSKWVVGGRRRSWSNTGPLGSWKTTQLENKNLVDGFLQLRVWGPRSANTFGAESRARLTQNFKDTKSHMIDFCWQADVFVKGHYDHYFMQITDGRSVPLANRDNPTIGWPGAVDLLTHVAGGKNYPGGLFTQGTKKLNWSIRIDPKGTATLYDGPSGTGNVLGSKTLPAAGPWYLRFMVYDATSSGFKMGDSAMNIYHFAAR